MDGQAQMDSETDKYIELFQKEGAQYLDPLENTGVRYTINGVSIVLGGNGMRPQFFLDKFTPATKRDNATKKTYEVRNRVIGRSDTGEPVFPGFFIDAFEFVRRFVPDPSWCSKSEWQAILKRLAPTLEKDARLAAVEKSEIAQRNSKQAQIMAQRENPTGFLAAGIATGISEALKNLGIAPKGVK